MTRRQIGELRRRGLVGGPVMSPRAAGLIIAGSLLLGFVGCLAFVAASAVSLGLTSWVSVAAGGVALLVAGAALLCLAAKHPSPRLATCPIDRELWRIIDEETGPRRR